MVAERAVPCRVASSFAASRRVTSLRAMSARAQVWATLGHVWNTFGTLLGNSEDTFGTL